MMRMTIAAATMLLASTFAASDAAAAKRADYAWVQMVTGGAELRTMVKPGSACPVARADGKSLPMMKRAAPLRPGADFPDTCQARLPAAVQKLKLRGRSLPVPKPAASRILVVGDTGCRVTAGESQNCGTDWPFGRISKQAAKHKPDLIVHVGDYYYRENCPDGGKHCENWRNWQLDLFEPAKPLLAAAPWVFARGNHENCARANQGWFRYLDEAEAPLPCPGAKPRPFVVPVGGLSLVVLDSADMVDAWDADRKLAAFADDIATLPVKPTGPQWIVTHKPPFVKGYMNPNFDGATAQRDPALPEVASILAGHLHLFGSFDFAGKRPSQLIVGGSGTRLMKLATQLDQRVAAMDRNAMLAKSGPIDGEQADYTVKGQFGYLLLERADTSSDAWTGTLYGAEEEQIARCAVQGRALKCASLPDDRRAARRRKRR